MTAPGLGWKGLSITYHLYTLVVLKEQFSSVYLYWRPQISEENKKIQISILSTPGC